MSSLVVSGSKLAAQANAYLGDISSITEELCKDLRASEDFQEVYRQALAADVILSSLDGPKLCPSLQPLRGIALRVPLFIAIGQSSVAALELRRFIELTLWTIYFTHHPVEWSHFDRKRGQGFAQDKNKPIGQAAHRELVFYQNYARELMEEEPSGLGTSAVNGIDNARTILNGAVHAGDLARNAAQNLPHETPNRHTLQKFATLQRNTFAHCLLLLAAFDRHQFDGMTAHAKAYFDWVIGVDRRRDIRKGLFGLDLGNL